MMIGQLSTSVSAIESRMTIPEGGSAGFSDDIRSHELAVIDHSPADTDRVTVIPASLLAANVSQREPIDHPDLPFKIQVHQWLPNSQLNDPNAGESNPATAGLGTRHVAQNAPPTTGVGESAAMVDYPSAYVELIAKDTGKSLGTYLTSLKFLDDGLRFIEQPVEVGGHTYDIVLRFQRIYHPFTLALEKVQLRSLHRHTHGQELFIAGSIQRSRPQHRPRSSDLDEQPPAVRRHDVLSAKFRRSDGKGDRLASRQ